MGIGERRWSELNSFGIRATTYQTFGRGNETHKNVFFECTEPNNNLNSTTTVQYCPSRGYHIMRSKIATQNSLKTHWKRINFFLIQKNPKKINKIQNNPQNNPTKSQTIKKNQKNSEKINKSQFFFLIKKIKKKYKKITKKSKKYKSGF